MPSSSLAADIAELGVLTRQLAQADRSFLVFGSKHHRYQFHSPLPETEIAAYEARHGIQIPADYRCFLATLGNGGPGPDYGLLRLQDEPRDLSQPFPGIDSYELPEDPLEDDELLPGILCICHQGCEHYYYLVVNGPAYGAVFSGTAERAFWHCNASFAEWYRHWAEQKLRILGNQPLLQRIHAGMSRHEVEALLPGEWTLHTNEHFKWRKLRHAEVPLEIDLDAADVVTKVRQNDSI